MSRLRIEVEATVPGLVVKRDGTKLSGSMGAAVPVDPGEHTVVASAEGYQTWSKTVTVDKAGDAVTVRVPLLATTSSDDRTPAQGVAPATVAGAVVGAVGLVAVGVGVALGVVTLDKVSHAEDDPNLCPNKSCSPEGREAIDSATVTGHASTVTLAVGGAAVVAGLVLVIMGVTSARDASDAAVLPWIGPEGVGFHARF
ncbi:MAG TPA: PEGA domain-containing protein [Polyangiaceae bacterium]|nr:PEGA domain-containing protein [Polyangiaceae bacterium]